MWITVLILELIHATESWPATEGTLLLDQNQSVAHAAVYLGDSE